MSRNSGAVTQRWATVARCVSGNREVETEHLPAYGYFWLGVVRRTRRRRWRPARSGRIGGCWSLGWPPESLHIARLVAEHARAKGGIARLSAVVFTTTPSNCVPGGQFAFAWVLNNRLSRRRSGGPRTEEQWEDYVAALSVRRMRRMRRRSIG